MGLRNIQTGTKAIMMKWPPIGGDWEFYLWIQITTLGFFCMLQYSLFFFFPSRPYGGFYTLYRLFLIIWALHLLIIQAPTWAPIPSDTSFSPLWVVVAKVTLFRGLLHINAARKVAAVHLMWWWQLFLRYFCVFFLFMCLGDVLQWFEYTSAPDFQCPRRSSSLEPLSLSPVIRLIT